MTDNLVILESMWLGSAYAGRKAPSWFPISPTNHSGRVLHKLLGPVTRVLVTNACPLIQASANDHGTPCPLTIARNVGTFPHEIRWLLVCGAVAQETFIKAIEQGNALTSPYQELRAKLAAGYMYPHQQKGHPAINVRTRIIFMPHPAARLWSNDLVAVVREFIASGEVGGDLDTGTDSYGTAGNTRYRFRPLRLSVPGTERAWRLELNTW